MDKGKDITGIKYNKLIAIKFVDYDKFNQARWLFKCDCGNERVSNKFDVSRGCIKSCGCWRINQAKQKVKIVRIGEKHHNWKGDKVGYEALHNWVRRRKQKPEFCEMCKLESPRDLANISQKYKRNVNDFEWLCRRCHMKSDGRMKNIDRTDKKNKKKILTKEELDKKREYSKNYHREYNKIDYQLHKEERSKKQKERRLLNPEKYRKISNNSYYKMVVLKRKMLFESEIVEKDFDKKEIML